MGRANPQVGPTVWVAALLAAMLGAVVFSTAGIWDPEPAASVTFTLYGRDFSASGGWGFTSNTITSPGPTLTVRQGDQVTMRLFSADAPTPHTFFVDYDGDRFVDLGEPESDLFSSRTMEFLFTFTANTAGRFTYWCSIHYGRMFGTFEVQVTNRVPTLSAISTSPGPFTPGTQITFTATASDLDGDILSYGWNFGDGTMATGQTAAGGGMITVMHAYQAIGNYAVSLTVNDGKGGTATASLTVSVVPQIVVTILAPWTQLAVGQTMDLAVKAQASATDLPDASVVVTVTSGLSVLFAAPTTGGDGTARITVKAIAVGAQSVTATVSKTGFATGTATYAINVIDPPLTMTMTLTSDTTEMMYFETATVRVHLADTATGSGVGAALITTVSPAGGNLSAVAELGGGDYAFRWDAPRVSVQTFVSISVSAKVGGYSDARGRVVLLVDPNMTNMDHTLFLIVEPEKFVLTSGETISVTVFVFTIEGFVVRGSTVTLRMLVPIGTLSPVTDRLNGVYTFTYTAPIVTSTTGVSIRIDASKLVYNAGFTRLGLQIVP